jgi:hypothetical protein
MMDAEVRQHDNAAEEDVGGRAVPGHGMLPSCRRSRRAIYPRCFLKKAATGSKDALVERFSLST